MDNEVTKDQEAPETYEVPESRFEELEAKAARYQKRAVKLGKEPFALVVVGEKVIREKGADGEPTGRIRILVLVQVRGQAPVVAGHTFIARVEHTCAGNIISKAPGAEGVSVPVELRDGPPVCDHCKTNRKRNDTFILRREDGSFTRVGRNCLADYLRSEDVAEALALWKFLHEVRSAAGGGDEEGCGGGSWFSHPGIVSFVAATARAIALHGWTSRKEAWEQQKTATSTHASFACGQIPSDEKGRKEWREAQPLTADIEEAKGAIEWAKGLEGASDYENNLKVACSLEYVKGRNEGLVASVIVGYRRHQERLVQKAREAKAAETSAHFGKIGSRYVRQLTVLKSSSWENQYGVTVLYVLQDAEGQSFKWFSSNGCWLGDGLNRRELKTGDEFWFTFLVKDHGSFRGISETVITRATPSAEKPIHKWICEATGEIFPSKKALQAA